MFFFYNQMDADESSILSGYLYVMDKTGYLNVMDKNKTWTRRWITVRDDFAVYFYKKHKVLAILALSIRTDICA